MLTLLNTYNVENPNTMILQFFLQGKSQELIKIFSKATPPDKAKALDLLQRIDVTSASKYKRRTQINENIFFIHLDLYFVFMF